MLIYPTIKMPDSFSQLLTLNMDSSGKHFNNLSSYLKVDRGFHALVKQSFSDLDSKLNINNIVNSLGWYGIRDRIANTYLSHKRVGEYLFMGKADLPETLTKIDEALKRYTVPNYSRSFLLALYLEMASYESENFDLNHFFNEDVLEVLDCSQAKIIKIDWIYIIINNLLTVYDKDSLKKMMNKNEDFFDIFDQIPVDAQKSTVKNLLAYGYSINERDVFTSRIV